MLKKLKVMVILLVLTILVAGFTACKKTDTKQIDGSYYFVIYEPDKDNTDLSDNPIVVKYLIEYTGAKTVTDSLIKKGDNYFFSEDSNNYLVLKNTEWGLSYNEGYFEEYTECTVGAIDISWSYTAVNGVMATLGIGETPLEGLQEYGFVINGWK